jgi:hypothetical protein
MPAEHLNSIEDFIQDKRRMESAGKLHWLHWLIVAGHLILTLLASTSHTARFNKNRRTI